MKNCAAPISKGQKLLLKVLTCLWNQFLKCKTHATTAFLKNPNDADARTAMETELDALAQLINTNAAMKKLTVPNFVPYAYILSSDAQGYIEYDTSGEYEAYNGYDNIANTKQFIKLNIDECLQEAYQVIPFIYIGSSQTDGPQAGDTYTTQAMVTARAGCQGVSNIGFVTLAIQVDIDAFPFKTCPCGVRCGSSSSSH